MAQNKQSPYRRSVSGAGPKAFDIAPTKSRPRNVKQPAFPDVGMTLTTYTGANTKTNRAPLFGNNEVSTEKWRLRDRISRKKIIIFIVLIIVLVGGYLAWKVVYNTHKLFGGSVFSVLTDKKLDGEDKGRVNILLAGNSADDPGHQGANLTDSIMILSIDTKNNTGFMLSVPRDLYVQINDKSYAKINTVYPTGQSENFSEDGYAAGGMGLLEKTIYEDFGVNTQYYALVNYNALRDATNAVGGIDVTINSSNPKGLYDPSKDYATNGPLVKLANGKQHLNGEQALDLARARGDARGSYGFPNSDFDRTQNQRLIILAIRAKATTAGTLANPVKLGGLFDAVGGNVTTDLSLGNVRRLYSVTKNINASNITSVGLNDANGKNLLANYRTPSGESALTPAAGLGEYGDIQQFIQQITSSNLVVREGASVVLLNGTSKNGLAATESSKLQAKNIAIDLAADADNQNYTTTQIINISGAKDPATLKALQAAYPGATVTTTNPFGTKYTTDFIVVLGSDRIPTTTTTSH